MGPITLAAAADKLPIQSKQTQDNHKQVIIGLFLLAHYLASISSSKSSQADELLSLQLRVWLICSACWPLLRQLWRGG